MSVMNAFCLLAMGNMSGFCASSDAQAIPQVTLLLVKAMAMGVNPDLVQNQVGRTTLRLIYYNNR